MHNLDDLEYLTEQLYNTGVFTSDEQLKALAIIAKSSGIAINDLVNVASNFIDKSKSLEDLNKEIEANDETRKQILERELKDKNINYLRRKQITRELQILKYKERSQKRVDK